MAKLLDDFLMCAAFVVAAVLFLLGVRRLFREETSLAKRGRFALYIALILAMFGVNGGRSATAEVSDKKIAKHTSYKNTSEWADFKKFWQGFDANGLKYFFADLNVDEMSNRFKIREKLTPSNAMLAKRLESLLALSERGLVEKPVAELIKKSCEGYLQATIKADSMRFCRKAYLPGYERRRFSIASKLEMIRDHEERLASLVEDSKYYKAESEQLDRIKKSVRAAFAKYNLETAFDGHLENSLIPGEWLINWDEFYNGETDALAKFRERGDISKKRFAEIMEKFNALNITATKANKLIMELRQPLEQYPVWKEFAALWKDLDAFDLLSTPNDKPEKEWTEADKKAMAGHQALVRRMRTLERGVVLLGRRRVVSVGTVNTLLHIMSKRLEKDIHPVRKIVIMRSKPAPPEFFDQMAIKRLYTKYELQIDEIAAMELKKNVKPEVLAQARKNAEKTLLSNIIIWNFPRYIFYSFPKPSKGARLSLPPELRNSDYIDFPDAYSHLDELLRSNNISKEIHEKITKALTEKESSLVETFDLIRRLRK